MTELTAIDNNTISELEEAVLLSGNEERIVSLLNAGAHPEKYLLYYAYKAGMKSIVQLFVKWGLEPDQQMIEELVKRGELELLKSMHIIASPHLFALATTPEMTEFLKKVQAKAPDSYRTVRVERPKSPTKIELNTTLGVYGQLTSAWVKPRLFQLDGYYWDSVERYMMYKMYEGTFKGNEILNAQTLEEAKEKFKIVVVPIAKTPKQLVLNQKLAPLAQSQPNPDFDDHCESMFIKATHAKIKQNRQLYQLLNSTNAATIINKNIFDQFGYVGNLLGNILMTIRDGSSKNVVNTNNMTIAKYMMNKNFYVIRGNPDNELKSELRQVCTFKTMGDKVVPGKYYPNLKGGGGWLVPNANAKQTKDMLFKTWPDYKKIVLFGQKWLKKQIDRYLSVASLVAGYREHPDVTSEDMAFTIQDIYGSTEMAQEIQSSPKDEFIQIVWKIAKNNKIVVSDKAIELLWNLLNNLIEQLTKNVTTFKDFKGTIENIDSLILDMPITPIPNLTERESIVIVSFIRLYRLIKRLHQKNESKLTMLVIQILVGRQHYEQIKVKYNKKIKNTVKVTYSNDEEEFRKRFLIKNHNISTILKHLPVDLSKKCKLFFLTTLDYILELEGEDGIEIAKNLILVSQRGKQPTPTPAAAAAEELEDILKDNNESDDEHSDDESSKKSSKQSDSSDDEDDSSKKSSKKSSSSSSSSDDSESDKEDEKDKKSSNKSDSDKKSSNKSKDDEKVKKSSNKSKDDEKEDTSEKSKSEK